ncbi:MAG: UDP-N-acetylglucosamine 2-epimerase [Desulfobacula sp.]|jgi:hypothetical protein
MDNFWKEKKITAYIALKHHTRFIVPIMERLAAEGAIVNYLVAQAERSQEITAIETGLKYNHVFDFIKNSDKDQIHEIYLDLRNTFGKALVKDIAFSLAVQTVLDKTLSTSAQEYIAFKNYFEIYKPDLCLALHEVNRWGKMFSFHAKKSGVPFITLQEGLLTAASANLNFQMTGHVQNSTFCFVWGENSREKLIRFEAPEDRVIPVGNTHLSDEIKTLEKKNIRRKKRKEFGCEKKMVALLLFSSDLPPLDEILPIFQVVQDNPDIKLFTKFHPATTRLKIDSWLESLSKDFKKNIHPVHGEENIYHLMAASDLCILAEGSTTGLEALALKKPLVLLQLKAPVIYKSNLVEEKAAIGLTPKALAGALAGKTDFESIMNHDGVQQYLQKELFKSEGSIEYASGILESVLDANLSFNPLPLISKAPCEFDWSVILPVSQNPENFLALLEKISVLSGDETYEVLLIRPETVSDALKAIFNSLEGNLTWFTADGLADLPRVMNQAAMAAKGRHLVFMSPDLAPKTPWFTGLKNGIRKYDTAKIFGARITNQFHNIVHAGVVLNSNHQPVSAYLHLDSEFPHACKTRPFQMVDHFICTEKDFFLSSGGFEVRSGRFVFLDFCLRAVNISRDPETILYLPEVELIRLSSPRPAATHDDAIFFYSRWHGALWESEAELLHRDGVSTLQIDAARMTRAMEIASLK